MGTARHTLKTRSGRAFSLVEVIVVVVLLAVLAAAVAPRIMGMSGRRTRAVAEQAAELLSVAARRDALTSQRVAIDFDATTGRLRLLTLGTDKSGGALWIDDTLTAAVFLGDSRLRSVSADGVQLDAGRWRVEFTPTTRRPELGLTLTDDGGSDTYQVELKSGSIRATASQGTAPRLTEGAIDLDAAGQGEKAW